MNFEDVSQKGRGAMSSAVGLAEKPDRADVTADLGALLAETATGNRQAFKQLYDLTSGKLYGIAYLLLRRKDAAEDALQEAYMRVWSHAGKYDPASVAVKASFSRRAGSDRAPRSAAFSASMVSRGVPFAT